MKMKCNRTEEFDGCEYCRHKDEHEYRDGWCNSNCDLQRCHCVPVEEKLVLKICKWAKSSTNPDGTMGMPNKCSERGCIGWDDMCKFAELKK